MKKKILFAVSLLFGLMFINSGLNKFFNYMPIPKDLPESLMKVMGAFMEIITAPSGLPTALVLLAINLWVIIENREKYLPMIKMKE